MTASRGRAPASADTSAQIEAPATRRSVRSVRWEAVTVPDPNHPVPVRIYRPARSGRDWLVWAHGGSWRAGSVEAWHDACADLAEQSSHTVVSVGYRLAPRHPHPAALTDVLRAMDWAESQAERESQGGAIMVGGDSAGGTIAACAALVWRDRDRPLAAQVLAYPPLDPQCAAPSYHRFPDAFPDRVTLINAWRDYRGVVDRTRTRTTRICTRTRGTFPSTPLEAEDLTGLAPAIIGVGALDPVADDVRTYATLLRAAGNKAELHEFPGLGHGAFLTDRALRRWLGTALSRRTP
jgi:acetyl esterase